MGFKLFILTLVVATSAIIAEDNPASTNALAAVSESLIVVETDHGRGSGFLCEMNGTNYIVTNVHVLECAKSFSFKLPSGKKLTPTHLELASDRDMARIRYKETGLMTLKLSTSAAKIGDAITVLGNSSGAGVITELKGKVQGIGPERIEVSANFVEGNSGSPILSAEGTILGLATFVQKDTNNNWINQGTRFGQVRRYGVKLNANSHIIWVPTTPGTLYQQTALLSDVKNSLLHFVILSRFMKSEKRSSVRQYYSSTTYGTKVTTYKFEGVANETIGYKKNAAAMFNDPKWFTMIDELCTAHDKLTEARYRKKMSSRSSEVTRHISTMKTTMNKIKTRPRNAIGRTRWINGFYANQAKEIAQVMPEIDSLADDIAAHYDRDWK